MYIACEQAPGEDGKKIGSQNEPKNAKVKNSERAIGAALRSRLPGAWSQAIMYHGTVRKKV